MAVMMFMVNMSKGLFIHRTKSFSTLYNVDVGKDDSVNLRSLERTQLDFFRFFEDRDFFSSKYL